MAERFKRTRAAVSDARSKVESAAKNRSKPAMLIYVIAGLIVLYLLFSRSRKLPDAAGKIASGFRRLWEPLTQGKT